MMILQKFVAEEFQLFLVALVVKSQKIALLQLQELQVLSKK